MTFITSDPTAIYRHALNAWVSPLATCALPKGVCYLLTYLLTALQGPVTTRPATTLAVVLAPLLVALAGLSPTLLSRYKRDTYVTFMSHIGIHIRIRISTPRKTFPSARLETLDARF